MSRVTIEWRPQFSNFDVKENGASRREYASDQRALTFARTLAPDDQIVFVNWRDIRKEGKGS